MSLLVSCDPGLRACGVAVFQDGVLVHAALVKNPVKKARGPEAWWGMADAVRTHIWESDSFRLVPRTYVLEVPQVYRFGKSRTDPDDLIQLAGVGGAVGAVLRPKEAYGYYPRQWKGQVPKEVMVARIEGRLTPEEVKAIQPVAASLRHNVLDGVGLGLHHLGRLGRTR